MKYLLIFFTLNCLAAKVQTQQVPDQGIQPQMVNINGVIHLLFYRGKEKGDLFYLRKKESEKRWSSKIKINQEKISRNSAISLARLTVSKNMVHVTWFNGKYFYARKDFAKNQFTTPLNIVKENIKGVEAGAALAANEEHVYLIWHAGALNQENKRGVFFRHSINQGKTFGPERKIAGENGGVCGCCGLAISCQEQKVAVLYRSAEKLVNRDMRLARSIDRGKSFNSQLIDKWHKNGCPVSTSNLAYEMAIWETKGEIFFARQDNLKKRGRLSGVNSARRKNPAIAVNDIGEILVAWGEGGGWISGGALHWQLFDNNFKLLKESKATEKIAKYSVVSATALKNNDFLLIY